MGDDVRNDRLKVDTGELQIGMFVVELDRPWTHTNFLYQGFRIRQAEEIRLLQEACAYVWVDARRTQSSSEQALENAAQQAPLQAQIAKVEFNQAVDQAAPVWHAAREESLRILQVVKLGQELDVAYTHHERLDGRGYPRGLDASRIPYFAKLVAVVDSYDAINSDRIYSKGRSSLESLRILLDAANTHFDEELVGHFIRMIGIYPPGEIAEFSNGEVGIVIGCDPQSKLKPRVLVVLDAQQQPCRERIVDLARGDRDPAGRAYRIREIHGSGAFGIDIEAYRRKGLVIPPGL